MNYSRVEAALGELERPMDRMRQRWLPDDSDITLRRTVLIVIATASVIAVAGAVLERIFDPDSFATLGDALWYSIATVSTTGYGDLVPETAVGRLIGTMLMLVGTALIPVITSVVVSTLIAQRNRVAREGALNDLAVIVERLDRIEKQLAER